MKKATKKKEKEKLKINDPELGKVEVTKEALSKLIKKATKKLKKK